MPVPGQRCLLLLWWLSSPLLLANVEKLPVALISELRSGCVVESGLEDFQVALGVMLLLWVHPESFLFEYQLYPFLAGPFRDLSRRLGCLEVKAYLLSFQLAILLRPCSACKDAPLHQFWRNLDPHAHLFFGLSHCFFSRESRHSLQSVFHSV